MAHKLENSYIKEVLALLQKFSGSQQISQLGDSAKALRTLREFDFKQPVVFDYRTSTGLEKQSFQGDKQNLVCTRTWEKEAVTPQETEPELPMGVSHLRQRRESTVTCSGVRGTGYNSPGTLT